MLTRILAALVAAPLLFASMSVAGPAVAADPEPCPVTVCTPPPCNPKSCGDPVVIPVCPATFEQQNIELKAELREVRAEANGYRRILDAKNDKIAELRDRLAAERANRR